MHLYAMCCAYNGFKTRIFIRFHCFFLSLLHSIPIFFVSFTFCSFNFFQEFSLFFSFLFSIFFFCFLLSIALSFFSSSSYFLFVLFVCSQIFLRPSQSGQALRPNNHRFHIMIIKVCASDYVYISGSSDKYIPLIVTVRD